MVSSTTRTAPDQKTSGKVIALAVAGAVGGFLFGFDSSVINGAVNAITSTFQLNNVLSGFAVASALLGCALGAYLAGRIGDRFGRIPAMMLGAILFLASAIGSAAAFAVWDLILWRVIGGIGIGIASVIAPAYIAEIAPRHVRGRLGSLQQLAITLGIFAALLSDALLANTAGGADQASLFGVAAWRWMFAVAAIPAIIYGVVAIALPESPRFLMLKERPDDAKRVLLSIAPDTDVDRWMRDIRASIAQDQETKSVSLRGERFGLKPVVWIGIILSVFQQFVGINVIFYYSTTLWQAVGFQSSDAFLVSVITSVTNVLVTLVAIALVDRIGRRPLLLAGSIGMTVSLAAMALAFSQAAIVNGAPSLSGVWAPIALVAANVFVIAFGATWGPLVWVLLGELFPNRIRGRALGLGAMAQWIANFIVTVTFPPLANASLVVTYGLYALFALGSFLFVLKVVPETNGMSLEEADTLVPPRGSARAGGAGADRRVGAGR